MLLTIGIIIALVSTYTEIKLVHGSDGIRKLYVEGITLPGGKHIDGVFFNTAGSFVLSYIIGLMFGAEGVTVMLGGALSTGLSQLYFSGEAFARKYNLSMARLKGGSNNLVNAKNSMVKTYRDFEQPLKDFRRGVLILLKIITIPFVVLRKMAVLYSERRPVT